MKLFFSKRRMIWIIAASVVGIVVLVLVGTMLGGVKAAIYKVDKGEMRRIVEGTAEAAARDRQTVVIQGSGKIIALPAEAGQAVHKGDLLLSLDKADLELQLKDAQAKVDAAEAQLQGAGAASYTARIKQAEAGQLQAQIAYNAAQKNADQMQRLYDSQALSRSELDAALNAYKEAKAALDTANAQLGEIRNGAPAYVKNGYAAQLRQAVAFRDTVMQSLRKQEVRAEMDGIILERLVQKGTPVLPGTAVFVIGNTGNLELDANILTDDIGKVQVGNPVEISGKAIGDMVLMGTVTKIAPAAKTVVSNLGISQKRVPVTIALTDEPGALKPGYDVDIKIITEDKSDALKVPDSAVFDYQGKSSVFVVENGKARIRVVQKGIESERFVEILQGLKAGESILEKPDNSIAEGAKIK